jgi:c-di-GMP-related signal transduction protein
VCAHKKDLDYPLLEVSVKLLPKLKIAHVIGKAVWDQRGDIRDVISIGKLVRKNDGPEEVEQIIRTMRYVEMKEL